MEKTAYLILENGKIFEGKSFGAEGTVTGEVVFSTAMIGYQETLCDQNYYGQIVVQTFPLIGNYGIIPADLGREKPVLRGYIVREVCDEPSNFRCEGKLDDFMKDNGVIGLYGIDTRALTRVLRENGVMNGIITTDKDAVDMEALKAYKGTGAVAATTEGKCYTVGKGKKKVGLLDLGMKIGLIEELTARDLTVNVYPADADAKEMIAANDGFVLSEGPGDPTENEALIETVKALAESGKPIFGLGLGHQLLALAKGGKTLKLKYGHRGSNQPVKNIALEKVVVSSQNHGYTVDPEALPASASVSFVNANDGSVEGLTYSDIPAFSVQFTPESKIGPHGTNRLYDEFAAKL